MRKTAPTSPPQTRSLRVPALAVDAAKYPNLAAHPGLERALRIRQALDKGKPRDEAVRLAEQAMGPRAPAMMASRPAAGSKSRTSGASAGSKPLGAKFARPKRTPASKRR